MSLDINSFASLTSFPSSKNSAVLFVTEERHAQAVSYLSAAISIYMVIKTIDNNPDIGGALFFPYFFFIVSPLTFAAKIFFDSYSTNAYTGELYITLKKFLQETTVPIHWELLYPVVLKRENVPLAMKFLEAEYQRNFRFAVIQTWIIENLEPALLTIHQPTWYMMATSSFPKKRLATYIFVAIWSLVVLVAGGFLGWWLGSTQNVTSREFRFFGVQWIFMALLFVTSLRSIQSLQKFKNWPNLRFLLFLLIDGPDPVIFGLLTKWLETQQQQQGDSCTCAYCIAPPKKKTATERETEIRERRHGSAWWKENWRSFC